MANKEAREAKEQQELIAEINFRNSLNKSSENYLDKFLGDEPHSYHFQDLFRSFKEEETEKLTSLCKFVKKNAPILDNNLYFYSLVEISKCPWVGKLEDLSIVGKSAESRLNSIIKHLIVKYTVPQFLYGVFTPVPSIGAYVGYQGARASVPQAQFAKLFVHLAQGGSVKKAVKDKLIPSVMTARMHHSFLNESRIGMTITEAVRHAQVISFGGSKRLWEAICAHRVGNQFNGVYDDEELAAWTTSEAWWLTVFQWLCKQPMLDPRQVGPILDYLADRKREDFSFQITGRTITTIIRSMEQWHEELNRVKVMKKENYTPSGIRPGYWKKSNNTGGFDHYSITEILTSRDLRTEGKAMSHCVVSYAYSIEEGRTSIWSFQINGVRTFTLEVINRNKSVVQVRGKYNRAITQAERSWVTRWAAESGLSLHY